MDPVESTFKIWEYLANQGPVALVMGLFLFFSFRYFTKQIEVKDGVIEKKDDEIKIINKEAKDEMHSNFLVLKEVNETMQKMINDHSNSHELSKEIKLAVASIGSQLTAIETKLK